MQQRVDEHRYDAKSKQRQRAAGTRKKNCSPRELTAKRTRAQVEAAQRSGRNDEPEHREGGGERDCEQPQSRLGAHTETAAGVSCGTITRSAFFATLNVTGVFPK